MKVDNRVKNPIKWFGGKFYLAKKIVELMPKHEHFLEGYGGGLSVLLCRPPHGCERVVDLNENLINFWKAIRDTATFAKFIRAVECVPFSNKSFAEAALNLRTPKKSNAIDVSRAVDFFVVCRMSRQGLLNDYATPTTRLRRGINENVSAWLSAVDGLPEVHARLKTVEVICGDILQSIPKFDNANSLFYGDPPYMAKTRSGGKEYGEFEVSERHHAILLETLSDRSKPLLTAKGFEKLSGAETYAQYVEAAGRPYKGKFILSGYSTSLYEVYARKGDWNIEVFTVKNNASSKKIKADMSECLWMNF